MDLLLLVSIGFGLAVTLIFAALAIMLRQRTISLDKRLDHQASLFVGDMLQNEQANKSASFSLRRGVPADLRARIAADLARADMRLTVFEYIVANLASLVIGGVLGYVLFRGNLLLAIVGALFGAYAPRFYVHYLQGRRLSTFDSQLNDTLLLLANSLRSGYGITQAIETVAREMAPPISTEFARVTREVSLGLTIQQALANLHRRMPSEDLDLIITTIAVQQEVGGNLSEILDTLAFTIRERVRIKREIRVLTAQQRFTGQLLAFLPVGLGLVIFFLSPGYMSSLWQNTCGWELIGAGVVWMIIGYLIIRRVLMIRV